MSDRAFHDVTQKGSIPLKDQNNHLQAKIELNEFSAREIQAFAKDIEKTNIKNQKKIDTAQHEFSTQIKIAVMTRLGIPLVRIAQRLNIHRETISKYAKKTRSFLIKFIRILKAEPLSLIWLKNMVLPSLWYGLLFFKKKQTRNDLRL